MGEDSMSDRVRRVIAGWARNVVATMLALTIGLAAGAASAAGLEPGLRKKLDTFLSAFSEVGFASFDAGQLTDDQMLSFAIDHLYDNDRKLLNIDPETRKGKVSAETVDWLTTRYFDQRIENDRHDSYVLEEPKYAEFQRSFSQVSDYQDIEGGLSRVTGDVYSVDLDVKIDTHAKPADWKRAGLDVTHASTFSAVVKKVENHYVLVSYREDSID
jgi:hypothetical protein